VVLWVLAPLFLASAGRRMDLTTLADARTALVAAVMLVVAVAGKFGGAFLGAGSAGCPHGRRWRSASA
jgi:Kef-type K+ transport system membrane component KefB